MAIYRESYHNAIRMLYNEYCNTFYCSNYRKVRYKWMERHNRINSPLEKSLQSKGVGIMNRAKV